MSTDLLARIRSHALSTTKDMEAVPASIHAIEKAESQLTFKLPPLLRACYLEIGNGGFGPGYGLIGFEGGAQSDFGSITETYNQLKSDQQSLGNEWPLQLLPFCDWGCNVFSCVDCSNEYAPISIFDAGQLIPQSYNLATFFEMWVGGSDILLASSGDLVTQQVLNPFTGTKTTVQMRKQV
jgi:hypothetical protein